MSAETDVCVVRFILDAKESGFTSVKRGKNAQRHTAVVRGVKTLHDKRHLEMIAQRIVQKITAATVTFELWEPAAGYVQVRFSDE